MGEGRITKFIKIYEGDHFNKITFKEGVNGVNRLATKGEKILLPTKRGRNYRLATKKLTEIYRQPTKVENFNRQSNEI